MLECPNECGWRGNSLKQHFRQSPHCQPPDIPPPATTKKKREHRDPCAAIQLFKNLVEFTVSKELLVNHIDQCMHITSCDRVRDLVVMCVGMTCNFVQVHVEEGLDFEEVVAAACSAFTSLPCAATMINQRRPTYQRAIPRSLKTGSADDKKGAVFFSAFQLVAIMLQESLYIYIFKYIWCGMTTYTYIYLSIIIYLLIYI